jgi:hypothetical protein
MPVPTVSIRNPATETKQLPPIALEEVRIIPAPVTMAAAANVREAAPDGQGLMKSKLLFYIWIIAIAVVMKNAVVLVVILIN